MLPLDTIPIDAKWYYTIVIVGNDVDFYIYMYFALYMHTARIYIYIFFMLLQQYTIVYICACE